MLSVWKSDRLRGPQTADTFIKNDPVQCWLDTKDVVHRHATGSIGDETSHSIKVDRYVSMQGNLAILVHVNADTHKKKGEGCRLYVGIIGQAMSGRGFNQCLAAMWKSSLKLLRARAARVTCASRPPLSSCEAPVDL